ncbi:RNA polymerase II-associated protein 3-like [Montipora foliosa]|uniref:RNA polymerase II-associated protein 3-like n=1 Tax=Montipora foliosa TaxID=591990 RepID=UPI0035F1F288
MADALKLQLGVRQNAEELQDILQDLSKWEEEMKVKDNELRTSRIINKQNVPPIRNKAKKKKKKKKQDTPTDASNGNNKQSGKMRINSYDYRSWDKLDVDKVLEEMDEKDEMKTFSSSEDETDDTDEDVEHERRLQRALLEKDKGNTLFKEGKFESAINCYTTGIQLDPTNAVLPANRAMCLLKLKRYGAAEADCNQSLSLDVSYTKAFLRRAAARFQLGRIQEAEADYREVLRLEPNNKQAQDELKNITKLLVPEQKEAGMKDKLRENEGDSEKTTAKSKKPLKRIVIEEFGSSSESEEDSEVSTTAQSTPSLITEEERANVQQAVLAGSSLQAENHKSDLKDSPCTLTLISSSVAPSPLATSTTSSQCQSPASKTRPLSTSKTLPVPKSSGQFQSDWRSLQKWPDQLFQYFKNIKPESYSKLFQQSIEPDMLVKILHLLRDFYISNDLPVYKEMKFLSEVKRFGMAVMFLSEKDKKAINDLLQYLQRNLEALGLTEEDVLNLARKYGLVIN